MHERGQDFIGGAPDENGVIPWWRVGRLWGLAAGLPVQMLAVEALGRFLDQSNLLCGKACTNRALAREAKRIFETDLSYPIILSAEGWLMDGYHRLCKAYALGVPQVRAVQFVVDPEPDMRRTKAELSAQGAVVI